MSKKPLALLPKAASNKNKIGFTDPKNPWIFCFKHEEENRTVNFKNLQSHCKRKAYQAKRPDLADDFSQWAVLENLERIERGKTKNGHLNDVNWLWNDYIEKFFGAKYQKSNLWKVTQNTFSYDNLVNDDGNSFLEFLPDKQNLNPEDALLLKEDLLSRQDEVKEALRDKKKERREERERIRQRREFRQINQNRLYDFFKGVAEEFGVGIYIGIEVRRALKMKPHEFNTAISNLVKSGKVIIKSNFFYLPFAVESTEFEQAELKKVG